jgi:hypothetical protein
MSHGILAHARHLLSSLIVTDEYGQWEFTERGAYAALIACLALVVVAQQLAWAWR